MTKENMMIIAERNLRKSKLAHKNNINRPGVTEQEIKNLERNLEYNQIVYDMISNL